MSNGIYYLPAQRPGLGKTLYTTGTFCILSGLISLVLTNFMVESIFKPYGVWGVALFITTEVLSLSVSGLGIWLVLSGRRHMSKVEDYVKEGPYIFFLRPFSEDGKIGFFSMRRLFRFPIDPTAFRILQLFVRGFVTYEAIIAYAFRKIAPLRTIGKPSEELPEIGAIRSYLEQSNWKETVSQQAINSQLVILCIGESEGVLWEVQECLKNLKPNQLVLALPYPGRKAFLRLRRAEEKRQETYETFRRKTASIFPHSLPSDIRRTQFIYFDDKWTPQKMSMPAFGPILPRSLSLKNKSTSDKHLVALEWLTSVLVIPVWWKLTIEFALQTFLFIILPIESVLILLTELSALAPFIYTLF